MHFAHDVCRKAVVNELKNFLVRGYKQEPSSWPIARRMQIVTSLKLEDHLVEDATCTTTDFYNVGSIPALM